MAIGRKRVVIGGLLLTISAVMWIALIGSKFRSFRARHVGKTANDVVMLTEGFVIGGGGPRYKDEEGGWTLNSEQTDPPTSIVWFNPRGYFESKAGPQGPITNSEPIAITSFGPLGEFGREGPYWWCYISAWPVPFAVGLLSVVPLWHGGRAFRRRPGHCKACGYDLRATPAATRCPECGQASSAKGSP